MNICLTFDTERDWYSTFRQPVGYKGFSFKMIKRSIPILDQISQEFGITYTFFVCGEVIENALETFMPLLDRHQIAVHTHPFTHLDFFKGKSPNDDYYDHLYLYDFNEQIEMIKRDLNIFKDYLGFNPTSFRAGKHGANNNTLKVLKKLGIKIDCSFHPPFQLLGWYPYFIPRFNIWEVPTYCDFDPPLYKKVQYLMKFSAPFGKLFSSVYSIIMHPMILGNINIKENFHYFKQTIIFCLKNNFEFFSIDDVVKKHERSTFKNRIYTQLAKFCAFGSSPFVNKIRASLKS